MRLDNCEYFKRWWQTVKCPRITNFTIVNSTVAGLIYRHYRPVYYSPSSHSALAEAELLYKDDHISHSAYVSFTIDMKADDMNAALREILSREPNAYLLVWTTTPWTLTANMVRSWIISNGSES
jgi:isoleucyl-tRNA synthetase